MPLDTKHNTLPKVRALLLKSCAMEKNMTVTREDVLKVLAGIKMPDGSDLVSRDLIRALSVEDAQIRFVIEAPTPD